MTSKRQLQWTFAQWHVQLQLLVYKFTEDYGGTAIPPIPRDGPWVGKCPVSTGNVAGLLLFGRSSRGTRLADILTPQTVKI